MTATEARGVAWICDNCAMKIGCESRPGHLATYHPDKCGVCGEETMVTEPRDFLWWKAYELERRAKQEPTEPTVEGERDG